MNIWRDYDQAGLDAQYATRSQIGDQYDAWTERWVRTSAATREARKPRLDVAYGSHPRQRMDIFPAPAGARGPVSVFFHGGFWRSRSKSDYSYVANGLASLGGPVAVVNYPLCPEVPLAEVVRSARVAVRWLLDHMAEIGGDGIVVSGHSAGAHLAAMCFCGDGSEPAELPAGAIKGAILSSGLYELEPTRLCFANADIKLDEAQVAHLSPARLSTVALDGPVVIGYGGAEPEEFSWQANELAAMLHKHGANAATLCVPDANHYTIVPQFAEPGTLMLNAFTAALGSRRAA